MNEKIVLLERTEKEQAVYKPFVENTTNNRIVFMGTPDFAKGCLRALIEAGMNVVAVVTMPDKQKGRGQKMQASPVKEYALQQGLPVMQPSNLKDEHFLQALQACRADLQIVVAFRMLPRQVWAMPPLGTFNLHASVLPRYRGAAPIQRAIWNGEKTTGVTTFLLDDTMDTGGILYQQEIPIADSDNAGSLHDKLLAIGAALVVKTAQDLFSGKVAPKPQPLSLPQTATNITIETNEANRYNNEYNDEAQVYQNQAETNNSENQMGVPVCCGAANGRAFTCTPRPPAAGCGVPAQSLTHADHASNNLPATNTLPAAPKIFKSDCLLDPAKTAQELHLQVRALSPYPTAFINLTHKETGEISTLKIFESEVLTESLKPVTTQPENSLKSPIEIRNLDQKKQTESPENTSKTPAASQNFHIEKESYQQGRLVIVGTDKLFLICANNTKLLLKDIQLSGKQRIKVEPFLRGFHHETFLNVITAH